MKKLNKVMAGGFLIMAVAGMKAGAEVMPLEKAPVETMNAAGADEVLPEEAWHKTLGVSLGTTAVMQSAAGAGTHADAVAGSVSLDLEVFAPLADPGRVYALFKAGRGLGVDAALNSWSGVNAAADDDQNFRLDELGYEYAWLGGAVRGRLGKIDLTRDFDANLAANSETDQFLSAMFVNNQTLILPGENGFGATACAAVSDMIGLGMGVVTAGEDVWGDMLGKMLAILEADVNLKYAGQTGHCRIYAWSDGQASGSAHDEEAWDDHLGFGVSLDQGIADSIVVFGRYGRQDGAASPVGQTWSLGLQYSGIIFGHLEDVAGLAYGITMPGDAWRQTTREDGLKVNDEHHVEVYYCLNIGANLRLTPDVQWVRYSGGDHGIPDRWIFGIRARWFL